MVRRMRSRISSGSRPRCKSLALPTPKASRSPDGLDLVHLVSFGDRRKAENLPGLLREDVADGIVFLQPLHDHDDGTTALVVLPARSEEHTSELQSRFDLVCRLLR